MRTRTFTVAAALAGLMIVLTGCALRDLAARSLGGERAVSAARGPAERPATQPKPETPPKPADKAEAGPAASSPATRPEDVKRTTLPEISPELPDRSEVNQAALEFAKNVPNVKHVKTCYSKMFGGWYLILYVSRGKKYALEQYLWNQKNREWEVAFQNEEVPAHQLEFHVKGEVGDEKCFVLKK